MFTAALTKTIDEICYSVGDPQQMDKENMLYIHNGVLFSLKEE
jgi:hypothetical protein